MPADGWPAAGVAALAAVLFGSAGAESASASEPTADRAEAGGWSCSTPEVADAASRDVAGSVSDPSPGIVRESAAQGTTPPETLPAPPLLEVGRRAPLAHPLPSPTTSTPE